MCGEVLQGGWGWIVVREGGRVDDRKARCGLVRCRVDGVSDDEYRPEHAEHIGA